MISITHSDPAELAEEEFLLPAGGRRMEMDWECVGRAFYVHRTSEFYRIVEECIGVEVFMSIWIGFYFKD